MPSSKLDGRQRAYLREAISRGFDHDSLDEVLRDNNLYDDDVSQDSTFSNRINSLIDVFFMKGRLIELCGVLAAERQQNKTVHEAIISVQQWLIQREQALIEQFAKPKTREPDEVPIWHGVIHGKDDEANPYTTVVRKATTKIFISYRRDDSAGHAGRVHDRLAREFGSDLLFMDVDGIPLGANFVNVLHKEVAKCSVLLAVIGHEWLDARDEGGRRRLDNPDDFVRVEIAAALQRDIPVIPILLEGTKIPRAIQLPLDLQGLALRNGIGVRHASFHADMDILIRGLKGRLAEADERSVPSLTPGTDKQTGMNDGAVPSGTARGVRDTTPNLRSAQVTAPQSDVDVYGLPLRRSAQVTAPQSDADVYGLPLHQVADRAVAAGVTNFPDENNKSIRNLIAVEPRSASDPGRPSDGVQHIAPPVDIRSRTTLFVFIGIAIVLIGAIGLMWPATSPRDSTTTVNPVTDTAGAPRDSSIRVAPIVKSAPLQLPEIFGSTIPSGSTTRDRRLQELQTQ